MMIMSHSSICYGIILIIICVLFCEPIVVISVYIMTVFIMLLKYLFFSVRSNKLYVVKVFQPGLEINTLFFN